MKWTIVTIMCLLTACAQSNSHIKEKVNEGPEIFNCKYVQLIQDTIKMMLIQDVKINFGDLYVEADSAFLDKSEKSVTAYGIKKARFKGNDIPRDSYKDSIHYKKGDARINED